MIESGATAYKVAKDTGLPYQTIQDRVTGKVQWGSRHGGHNKVLTTAEEANVASWALEMCRRGVPVTMKALCQQVAYQLRGDTRTTGFTDGVPGRRWVEGFLARNPWVTQRVTQLASRQRLEVSVETIGEWFRETGVYTFSITYVHI